MMAHLSDGRDDVLVTCSCGKKTTVRFNRSALGRDGKPGGRWIASDKDWKFRTVIEAEDIERATGNHVDIGWYCGVDSTLHYQAAP